MRGGVIWPILREDAKIPDDIDRFAICAIIGATLTCSLSSQVGIPFNGDDFAGSDEAFHFFNSDSKKVTERLGVAEVGKM